MADNEQAEAVEGEWRRRANRRQASFIIVSAALVLVFAMPAAISCSSTRTGGEGRLPRRCSWMPEVMVNMAGPGERTQYLKVKIVLGVLTSHRGDRRCCLAMDIFRPTCASSAIRPNGSAGMFRLKVDAQGQLTFRRAGNLCCSGIWFSELFKFDLVALGEMAPATPTRRASRSAARRSTPDPAAAAAEAAANELSETMPSNGPLADDGSRNMSSSSRERVLSQEEIDKLLGSALARSNPTFRIRAIIDSAMVSTSVCRCWNGLRPPGG